MGDIGPQVTGRILPLPSWNQCILAERRRSRSRSL